MLSGDVNDFALRDVLQLLATTNKSGLLTLRLAGGSGGVFVRDGGICLALVDVTRVPLGHRIISAGLADANTVRNTLRTADTSAFDLACALMRAVSDTDKARALATEHTRDAIGWLSQYSDARFEFDQTVTVAAWPFEPLATGEVLAEVESSAQQWAELHGVVGDLSVVPHCVPSPKGAAEISLTALQWRVVALVDGHRSIGDLVELVGLGQLDLGRELGGLVGKGLVELVGSDGRRAGNAHQDVVSPDAPDVEASTSDEPVAVDKPAAADDPVPADVPVMADEPAPAQPLPTNEPGAIGDANIGLLNRLIGKSRSA